MPTKPPTHSQLLRAKMPKRKDHRPSPTKRGYDATWRKLRALVLAQEPLCRECTRMGRTTPADMVHHVVPWQQRPDLRLKRDNLEPLCNACHARKSAAEGHWLGNGMGRGVSED